MNQVCFTFVKLMFSSLPYQWFLLLLNRGCETQCKGTDFLLLLFLLFSITLLFILSQEFYACVLKVF